MGQKSISRFGRAGIIAALAAALAVAPLACSNGGDDTDSGAQFNQGPAFNSTVWSIAPAGDGSGGVYVGGDFTEYNGTAVTRVARLNSNGTVDTAFATGTGFNKTVYSIVPVGDGTGDVYVGGAFTSYNGRPANDFVRLHADGTIDTNFVTGAGFNNLVRSIALAGDGTGDLYVGGAFTNYNGIPANDLIRLHVGGLADLTFPTDPGFTNTVLSIVPVGDGSGQLYVAGAFSTYKGTSAPGIVRLNASATVDQAFVTGTGFNDAVYKVMPAGDGTGKLYVGGAFTSYKGTTTKNLVRLTANGTFDPSFVTGTGFDNTVFSIALPGDGSEDLYVGGSFTRYNGTPANDAVRLNANGTVDPAFITGAGFNNTVLSIVPVGDGSGDIYVGGEFTQYQGIPIGRFVRLTSAGSLIR